MVQTNLMFEEIEDEEMIGKILTRQNPLVFPEPFVKFKPSNCFLPREYVPYYNTIMNMEVRDDDVWVISMPKAGTTWTQEMVWLLAHDLDYEGAKTPLMVRFPYFEFDGAWRLKNASDKWKEDEVQSSIELVINTPSPRYIKTHLPLNMLPKQIQNGRKTPKIIYVARNPKDQCVSFYHHKVLLEGYRGTLEEFVEEFVSNYSLCAPFWTHVREFWEIRHHPNVHFSTYETMKKDLPSVVTSMAKFFGKTLSETDFQKLLHHLSFDQMKTNVAVNYDEITDYLTELHGVDRKTHFIRKGQVGTWKDELSADAIQKFDKWIADNRIDGIWENY